MIRKHTTFVGKELGNSNRAGSRAALRFESNLAHIAREFSMFPENSNLAFLEETKEVFKDTHYQMNDGEILEFVQAAKRAHRSEGILRIGKDDVKNFVVAPVSFTMKFFFKSMAKPFYEVTFYFDDGFSRIYKMDDINCNYYIPGK